MASRIRPVKNGILTSRGWVHERTGEVLKAMKVTPEMLNEYYGVATEPVVVNTVLKPIELCPCGDPNCGCGPDCDCEPLTEDAPEDISKLTKTELKALAKDEGIEVDSKDTKKSLLNKISAGFLN
jgi:hypothetical protein